MSFRVTILSARVVLHRKAWVKELSSSRRLVDPKAGNRRLDRFDLRHRIDGGQEDGAVRLFHE